MIRRVTAVLASALTMAACDGGSTTPTGPSADAVVQTVSVIPLPRAAAGPSDAGMARPDERTSS
jgi:hypothetical protein